MGGGAQEPQSGQTSDNSSQNTNNPTTTTTTVDQPSATAADKPPAPNVDQSPASDSGPPPPPNVDISKIPNINDWLAQHPTIANEVSWQKSVTINSYGWANDVAESDKVRWPKWSDKQKQDLEDAFVVAWTWLVHPEVVQNKPSSSMVYPPPNIAPDVANDAAFPFTIVGGDYAWKMYIMWVAHTLAVETSGVVPWSITDYTSEERQIFLDSTGYMTIYADNGITYGYRLGANENPVNGNVPIAQGYSSIWFPQETYEFLQKNDMIRNVRLDTIGKFLDWTATYLTHFGGDYTNANHEYYWAYRGMPPVPKVLEGTTMLGALKHWTAGCHGTVDLIRNILRAVNIPVSYLWKCKHAQVYFPSEGLLLDHGDDLYGFSKSGLPATKLLINKATYISWFGDINNSPDSFGCSNLGRQTCEVLGYNSSSYCAKYK